jgi:hypothetical protein
MNNVIGERTPVSPSGDHNWTVPCQGWRTLSADTFAERHLARPSGSCARKGLLDLARTPGAGLSVSDRHVRIGVSSPSWETGAGSVVFAQRVAPSRTPGRIVNVPGRPGNLFPERLQ